MQRFRNPLSLSAAIVLTLLFAITLGLANAQSDVRTPDTGIYVTVSDEIALSDVRRFGINIGSHDQFGAAQILKNVITNPGFEGEEFATVFLTLEGATPNRVQQDNWQTTWNNLNFGIGQPEGFWNGATYEIAFGNATGRTGRITDFTHEDDRYTYYLGGNGAAPEAGSVIFVRKQFNDIFTHPGTFAEADSARRRPGSPGRQSLRLMPPDIDWRPSHRYYLDALRRYDPTAGRLLQIDGTWRFEIWARAENAGDTLEVFLWRELQQDKVFFSKKFALTTGWRLYTYEFTVPYGMDGDQFNAQYVRPDFVPPIDPDLSDAERAVANSAPILELAYRIKDSGGDVWIDDAALYRTEDSNPTVFVDRFVRSLKELNPSILRNWGNQLGSSLDNQLAPAWGRRTTAYQPREQVARLYHYSLHEFLELAAEVGAEPWYVIPPTFTNAEMANLMAYLAAPAGEHPYADRRAALGQEAPWTTVFPMIHLEYGNEMWGSNDGADSFIGATVRGGERVGTIGNRKLAALRASNWYDPAYFDLVLGGQYGFPYRQYELDTFSKEHNSIALAPYFGNLLDDYADDREIYYSLYARLFQDFASGPIKGTQYFLRDLLKSDTNLAIYEINFHTTFAGDVPLDIRNDFVSGLSGALAMPLTMLTFQRDAGIRNQMAFQTLQYAYAVGEGPNTQYVRLWGMLRDLETMRKRPTWLGLEMVNRAICGDMAVVDLSGTIPRRNQPPANEIVAPITYPLVHAFAFREEQTHAVVLFNLHLSQAQTINLSLPEAVPTDALLYRLSSNDIHADNEDATNVKIEAVAISNFAQEYTLTLKPNALVVLTWGERPEECRGHYGGIAPGGIIRPLFLPIVRR